MKAGANISAGDPNNITPTLLALINGHYDFAAFMIDQGADPNIADETGRTPLFTAVDDHTMPESNLPAPRETDNKLTSMDVIKALLAHRSKPQCAIDQTAAVPHQGGSRSRHDARHRYHADAARS